MPQMRVILKYYAKCGAQIVEATHNVTTVTEKWSGKHRKQRNRNG